MSPQIGFDRITPFQSNGLNYSKRLIFFSGAGILLIVSIFLSIKTQYDCTELSQKLQSQQQIIADLIQNEKKYNTTQSDLQKRIQNVEDVNSKQLYTDIAVLKEKVEGIEKTSRSFIEYIIKSKTLTEYNQRIINLEYSFQKFNSDVSEVKGKVEGIEKTTSQLNNQINLQGNQTQISQNNTDTLIKFQNELEYLKSQILSINQDLSIKFNTTQQNINVISASLLSLPSLSSNLQLLSGVVNSLSQQVPALNQTFSANWDSQKQAFNSLNQTILNLNQKINSETFNKVEIRGPYFANQHFNPYVLSYTRYNKYETTQSCELNIKGKAIVTLIATGIASCPKCEAQLTFMKNGKVEEYRTGLRSWVFGQQYIIQDWNSVSLTQEFMIDEASICDFSLMVRQKEGIEGEIVYLNAILITAKITYIS